jgi:hypothetical protein
MRTGRAFTFLVRARVSRYRAGTMSFWSKLGRLFSPGGQRSGQQLFAAEVVAALRELPAVTAVVERPDDFALTVRTGAIERVAYLGNIFAETRDLGPSDRAARIRRFIKAVGAPVAEDEWSSVRGRLVPLLRASSLRLTPASGGADLLCRGFAPCLLECVGIDGEDSFQLVVSANVEAWKMTAGAVFDQARKNATGAFRPEDTTIYDRRAPYPLWRVSRDDSYESSRLVLPGWLASFASKVKGRPVAIAPHRSFVLVGGDGDEACLERLIDSAQREHSASPRNISPGLYTVDAAGAVVPLVLPLEHRLFNQVALGHLLLATTEYQAQQQFLQRERGEGVFVAPFVAVQAQDGRVASYTTWTQEVPSLLPETDQIAFVIDPAGSPRVFRVPWAVAAARIGDCLVREPGTDPPRWHTARWPDPETLAAIEAAAV